MVVAGDLKGCGGEKTILVQVCEDVGCHNPVLSGQVCGCLPQDVAGQIDRFRDEWFLGHFTGARS